MREKMDDGKLALTAAGGDIGNTLSVDMGNTFYFISGHFHDHVVERDKLFGEAIAVCEVGLSGPTKHVAIVSDFPYQSKDWVSMVGAFRSRRSARPARAQRSSASLARSDYGSVGEAH